MKRINVYEEANRCLMCQDAPCTKACKTGDPARAVRAIRFDNHKLATSVAMPTLRQLRKRVYAMIGPYILRRCCAAYTPTT